MRITCDWHIHSEHSCDMANLPIADLIEQAAATGIEHYAVTDHLHTPYNLPDIVASRAAFDRAKPPVNCHFGIELSCVSQWELDELAAGDHPDPVYGLRQGGPAGAAPALGTDRATLDRYGVEYVVAGTHWPLYVPLERQAIIADYHRQNMFLATHPLVDIVAHPWWWHGHWADEDYTHRAEPWFDDFGHIPQSMHDEFAAAAIANDTKVEINISAMLLNPFYPARFKQQYVEYLARLRDAGVTLSIGSDCHGRRYDIDFAGAAAMLDTVGITEADLWVLPPRQAV